MLKSTWCPTPSTFHHWHTLRAHTWTPTRYALLEALQTPSFITLFCFRKYFKKAKFMLLAFKSYFQCQHNLCYLNEHIATFCRLCSNVHCQFCDLNLSQNKLYSQATHPFWTKKAFSNSGGRQIICS